MKNCRETGNLAIRKGVICSPIMNQFRVYYYCYYSTQKILISNATADILILIIVSLLAIQVYPQVTNLSMASKLVQSYIYLSVTQEVPKLELSHFTCYMFETILNVIKYNVKMLSLNGSGNRFRE